MATDNGEAAEAVLDHKRSVKKDDFARGTIQFVFPSYGYDAYFKKAVVLPRRLPYFNRWAFYTERDWTLLTTPYHEAVWANTVAIATTKAAAWGWEAIGDVPLRRKRLHELCLYATVGVFVGWVPFISAHLRSFLLTGKAIVEIERSTAAAGSRITALHHLNPLRCRFTDNPRKPVEYLDRRGQVHLLEHHQVMMFVDNPSPTEGDIYMQQSAAERVYDRIGTMEATHRYLYEKITGARALSYEFIQGVTQRMMEDAEKSSLMDRERSGNMLYRGVVAIPVPGDVPVQRVSIPIAEIPDGFAYQEIHDNTVIDYCASTGMDVNDVDPRLAQRASLGSGAQAVILAEKEKGKGLSAWRRSWTDNLAMLVAGTDTKFAWSERSLDDEGKAAINMKTRVETRKVMQEAGEIDQDQARSLAADEGDIPKEFLDKKVEKPQAQAPGGPGGPPQPGPPSANGAKKPTTPADEPKKEEVSTAAEKEFKDKRKRKARYRQLLLGELDEAREIATGGREKHLGGKHDQQAHGKGGGGSSGGELAGKLQGAGGFTYDPRGGSGVARGYALSLYPEREKVFAAADVTPAKLEKYIGDNMDLLSKEDHYVGGWLDVKSGKVYMDISVVMSDPSKAMAMAREQGELAYYDLEKGESVYTGVEKEWRMADKAKGKVKGTLVKVDKDDPKKAAEEMAKWIKEQTKKGQ